MQLKKLVLFFILSIFSIRAGWSQESDSSKYIKSFPDKFQLKGILQYRPMTLRVQEPETKESVTYRPNVRPSIGIGGNVVDIGFAFIFKLPDSFARDIETYGDTDVFDFQLNFYRNKFALDFHYQYYTGFYVAQTNELPEVSFSTKPIRPELLLEGASLNGVYVFNNERFSYPAIFNNSQKQKKSAGSFLAHASVKHLVVKNDSTLVPLAYQNYFKSATGLEKGYFTGFSLLPGYSYTFTIKDFYLNLSYAIGPDLQYRKVETARGATRKYWALERNSNLRAGLGYDSGGFFAAIVYFSRRDHYQAGGMDLAHDSGFIRLSVGTRLQEMRWMKKVRNHHLYQQVMNLF